MINYYKYEGEYLGWTVIIEKSDEGYMWVIKLIIDKRTKDMRWSEYPQESLIASQNQAMWAIDFLIPDEDE